MLKKYKTEIIVFYIFAAAALICASFFDLKIDIMLNNPDQTFSIFFQGIGEVPRLLICPFAGVIIYYLCDKPLLKAFGLVCNIGNSGYLGYHIARYFFTQDKNQYVFGVILGVLFGVFIQYFGKYINVKEEYKKPLIILAFAGIAVLCAQVGIIESVKSVWGRVRFRDLKTEVNYESFTPWYHPNGINGNRSFPSGHTASAGMSYLMMFLPYLSDKWERRKTVCFLTPFVYTSVVAFTRLVMGAHYLSDVTMGGIVAFSVTVVAIKILDKKYFNSCILETHNV